MVPVDNTLYDSHADAWWREDGFLHFLHTGLNPARVGYFRKVLGATGVLGPDRGGSGDPGRPPALDVGCGGGLLAEPLTRLGLAVTGVDPSEASLDTARRHARNAGLPIRYVRGIGERLPFADGTFAAVFCCDVLEHVASVDATVAEIARVLRPGGVFCYDTVNRTWRSWLAVIKAMQDWRFFTCMPGRVHDWAAFIRPTELVAVLTRHGLVNRGLVGFAPAGGPLGLLRAGRAMHAGARDRISYGEVGRRMRLVESKDRSSSYGGWAVKAAQGAVASIVAEPSTRSPS